MWNKEVAKKKKQQQQQQQQQQKSPGCKRYGSDLSFG